MKLVISREIKSMYKAYFNCGRENVASREQGDKSLFPVPATRYGSLILVI
jgi:hypothetical protein